MSWRNLSRSGLSRASNAVLIDAYLELTGQKGASSYSHPRTKAGLVSAIEKLLDEEREARFALKLRSALADPKPKPVVSASTRHGQNHGGITAAQVNEWLRSLPMPPTCFDEADHDQA